MKRIIRQLVGTVCTEKSECCCIYLKDYFKLDATHIQLVFYVSTSVSIFSPNE